MAFIQSCKSKSASIGHGICHRTSALRDKKKSKVVIGNWGVTGPSTLVTRRFIDGHVLSMNRPQVFSEYEVNKGTYTVVDITNVYKPLQSCTVGAVDTANNRRDNLISFHDVMKSYRW